MFVSLTALLVGNYATKRVPELIARGLPTDTIVDAMLQAVPFTAAMTIPMAVLIAVLWVFTRLGAEGVLATARRERHGVRRLIAPVLRAAAVVAALTVVSNAELVPRANQRLATVLEGAHAPGDREMTIGALRTAAQSARADAGQDAVARAPYYEVEIQKKYAIAAASVVLALTGVALAVLFPRGGIALVIGAGVAVIGAYYTFLVAGESLADRLVLSPFVAMWMANGVFLACALLVLRWRRRGPIDTVTFGRAASPSGPRA